MTQMEEDMKTLMKDVNDLKSQTTDGQLKVKDDESSC